MFCISNAAAEQLLYTCMYVCMCTYVALCVRDVDIQQRQLVPFHAVFWVVVEQ